MIYLLSWYAQDFLQVLGTGTALVPEVFLLTLVVFSVFRPERGSEILWAAFFGGVLWDLRWVGFPGITSLVYGITLTAMQLFWNSLPVSGRTVPLFGASLLGASIPIALTRIFLSGHREGGVFTAWLLQQSYMLPLLLLACALYAWRLKNIDV
ncbi:MAG: hypothetical protein GX791_01300 [Synergistaceae bacterium]|nr:hypothetical protein [Synergistaceae bacterium]